MPPADLSGSGHKNYGTMWKVFNTHMKYDSYILNGLKVMAKVKVFVYAANAETDADADANGRAMTLAPRTFVPAR